MTTEKSNDSKEVKGIRDVKDINKSNEKVGYVNNKDVSEENHKVFFGDSNEVNPIGYSDYNDFVKNIVSMNYL